MNKKFLILLFPLALLASQSAPASTFYGYSGAPNTGVIGTGIFSPSASRITPPASTLPGLVTNSLVVSNLNDSGPGSFRQALLNINLNKASTNSVITFTTNGTITLLTPPPFTTKPVVIDGTTAPGFTSNPVVSVNFNGHPGIVFAPGSGGSTIKSLSLVDASIAALRLQASKITIDGNFIGVATNGAVIPNYGDGIRIFNTSGTNLIGSTNTTLGVNYTNTSDSNNFTIQPVSAWQGLRGNGTNVDEYLISGSSETNGITDGLLYIGSLDGGGASYFLDYPGTNVVATSVYGPDKTADGKLRLVGSYQLSGDTNAFNHGFVWVGTTNDFPSEGSFRTIDYPGAKYQFTHSVMGDLAVGNADQARKVASTNTLALGPGIAYIYNVKSSNFVGNIVFPGSKSTTAYGIWYNQNTNGSTNASTSYTICGGYSPVATNNLTNQNMPLTQGKGYLVDYDSSTKKFSNWASFNYPNGPANVNFVTHFEGISSKELGVYNLVADSAQTGSANPAQGSWVSVHRNAGGGFDKGYWVDLNAASNGVSSANSVYGDKVVGLVIGPTPFAYQATIVTGFHRSNLISGNRGNGITLYGSSGNTIAMNYIGTDAEGSTNGGYGNGYNGILLTLGASGNLIGGRESGDNNPTGDKGASRAVFQRPPQGNLISGNQGDGVLMNSASIYNTLCGNYIGTDARGVAANGNGFNGVEIDGAANNSLIGSSVQQSPFVYYNVIGGNGNSGVYLDDANNFNAQGNFIGIGASNNTIVPNGGDGVTVAGTSKDTVLGGAISLGNVISGNSYNGVEVMDQVSGFTSSNTFGGTYAFGGAAPNGRDGILITSTGAKNSIQNSVFSGNNWNGIELAGTATKVEVIATACGTDTSLSNAVPNQLDGLRISDSAHHNIIGGSKPLAQGLNYFSGNNGYGISVITHAHDNQIYNSEIGRGMSTNVPLPNQWGGIYLAQNTYSTTIGATKKYYSNDISANIGGGITMLASVQNTISGNSLNQNTEFGVYAVGVCTQSVISGNVITNNGTNSAVDNVDLIDASGIVYIPKK